ncbi:MAG TPA: DNA polymerase III subunit delta [Vicinamibacteria bacterium]|nr:DNA polymerase III subunit delta [Vicinamibacteria bacterium]
MARSRGARVFAILGADSYLAEEALESLLREALGEEREAALQVLRGDETTWARVLDAARARSLFAAKRAVVVRGAEALKGPEDELAAYLEDPNPDATLVFMAAKPDRRRTAWRTLLQAAETIPAEPLKGASLRARVKDELRRRRLPMEPEAAAELVERVGQDLRRLMGELDKLEAFAAGGKGLTAEDVAAVLGRGFARPFWLLGDALAERRTGDALGLALGLLEDGEEAPLLVGGAYQALRRLWGLKALRASRASREEKLQLLPKNQAFKLPDLERSAEAWTESELLEGRRALRTADRRVKVGGNPSVALAAAIAEACPKAGGARTARSGR